MTTLHGERQKDITVERLILVGALTSGVKERRNHLQSIATIANKAIMVILTI